jgi:osmotically inducible protein OsmC
MLRCWSEPRAICFALLGNLVPRIVFRIHVFKTERSDRAHLRHVFTGLRPVEVRRIAAFKTRFENEKGTNPEELVAAAHAGCFTMALAFGLQAGGYTPSELTTEAAVTLEPEGQGFRISRSALTLRAQVPNLDEATFVRMAGDAEKNCPVSKVLNAAIALDAKLI